MGEGMAEGPVSSVKQLQMCQHTRPATLTSNLTLEENKINVQALGHWQHHSIIDSYNILNNKLPNITTWPGLILHCFLNRSIAQLFF